MLYYVINYIIMIIMLFIANLVNYFLEACIGYFIKQPSLISVINPRDLRSRFVDFLDNFDLLLLNKLTYSLSSCPLYTIM